MLVMLVFIPIAQMQQMNLKKEEKSCVMHGLLKLFFRIGNSSYTAVVLTIFSEKYTHTAIYVK